MNMITDESIKRPLNSGNLPTESNSVVLITDGDGEAKAHHHDPIRDLIQDINKKKLKKERKPPKVWRQECIWGIQPEFQEEQHSTIHGLHKHKINYWVAKQKQTEYIIAEQDGREIVDDTADIKRSFVDRLIINDDNIFLNAW